MKNLFSILILSLFATFAMAQSEDEKIELKNVEASCGQCNFGLEGKGCNLAVKIDGKAYFVDNVGINQHGNSHGEHGYCMAIRKADIKGKIVDGRFKAKKFDLHPAK
ncbi:DUF6370 family protein [Aureibacter tunicatorum]|uniref:Glutaminyl-tRNA synthetase n=1 Tax=Aureibacter tunicatorum TaxID=866807 RepID=A0AAE3XMF1_9BACT|nr:DUF6370 family protein [Aureibacter tunicatorum]MDR6238605.1 hypothetical protein [Aureibacter tunicatorum]BDD05464.1 hypothetical protein AUTU_29470 [Aureibacter tunicatorum]